jgi:uncharacterized membrane protein
MEQKDTALGVSQNLAGLLTYVLGFITGILFLILEKENTYVRFHAMQSTIVFGALFIINIILGFIPVLGWILSLLLSLAALVLWIVLMLKAFQGEMYKVPYAGDIAMKETQGKA